MLELDSNNRFQFPGTAYSTGNYALLCVNIAFIPFFRQFFHDMQEESRWSTRDDWWRSYQVFSEMEHMLMTGCATDMIEAQNRLYRLLDSSLNGTEYTVDPDTQAITPAIPAVPANPAGITSGLRRQLLDMQGIINAGWFGIGGQNATLADIVNALRVGSASKKSSLLGVLGELLAAGGNIAEIFRLVESLLADTVDASEEGAIVGVLIASTMAQAATASAQAAQLQALIDALTGGTTPATNVITELVDIHTLLG